MNSKRAKELRRIAKELAAREDIRDERAYRVLGPFKKKIDVLEDKGKPIFDEKDGKQVKRQYEVTGYTRVCIGVRGIYLALKKAYAEALARGDRRPLREIFADDLRVGEVEAPQTYELREAA